jgi:hypothetical protein
MHLLPATGSDVGVAMSWVPKPDALRRWREFRQMTAKELIAATRNGVKERTIRQLESKQPQKTVEDLTVRALAKALCEPAKGIVCHPEFLAWWRERNGTLRDADPKLIDPSLATAPKTAPLVVEEPPADPSPAAKRRALTTNAERERNIGRHRDTVKLSSGDYPLVGCDWLQEIEHQFAEYVGQTFAIAGLVSDQRVIPAKAADRLKADVGRGAAYFKIVRKASGTDDDGLTDAVTLFPTVFAIRGEHGKALSRCLKDKVPVTVLVHIVTTERKVEPGGDRWEGYFVFEVGRPTPKLWAFVVDEVHVDEPAAQPTSKRKRAAAQLAPGGVPLE